MSLTRQFMDEFRPLLRLLDDPFGRQSVGRYYGGPSFDRSFFPESSSIRPAVDLTEEGNTYVVEADLPGVRKEDVDVRIGDGGQSVRIEGRVVSRRGQTKAADAATAKGATAEAGNSTTTTDVAQTSPNQLSTERQSVSSIFTRTVWLPRPVDTGKVTAKLDHGVLTLTMEKADDAANVKVAIQ